MLLGVLAALRLADDAAPRPEGDQQPLPIDAAGHVLLLIFTGTLSGKKFRKQQNVILDHAAWLDRSGVTFCYAPTAHERYLPAHAIDPAQAAQLRMRLHVPAGEFQVVIASADGEVYLSSDRPLMGRELQAVLSAAIETLRR
jgi:hypothetical protein